jgi:hypothetical protein
MNATSRPPDPIHPDPIPPTEVVRQLLALRCTETARLRQLLRLAVRRDRDAERLSGLLPPAGEVARD